MTSARCLSHDAHDAPGRARALDLGSGASARFTYADHAGGTTEPVSYIAFTGAAAKVSPIEDHAAAVALGTANAKILLGL